MLKHIAIAVTCALYGCGTTLPADAMTRFAETLEATKHAYLALCGGREVAPECTSILESVNVAISTYTELNDQLKD